MSDIPRRICHEKMVPAEKAILVAIRVIEAMPPDERLTHAQILLAEAQNEVADYVDATLAPL